MANGDGNGEDPKSTDPRDVIGEHGEALAVAHLRDRGWTIRDRNVEWKIGEIDVVATRREMLGDREIEVVAFVEVKTRSASEGIPPEANVTPRKRRRLVKLGKLYLQTEGLDDVSARFDIVTVELAQDPPDVSHYPAAFDALGRFN